MKSWIVGLIKKTLYKMTKYFHKPFRSFGGNINVKVDLLNYATKVDMKNISHVDTSSFTLKPNLVSLKTEFDKLDVDKLVLVPVDLSKLSNAVKMRLLKRLCMINQFNNIDPSGFFLKTKYDADKTDLEKKIPNTNRLVKKSDYNAKISELEIKIPSISGLVTNSALTEVENKTPSVSSLIKKTNYNKKVGQLEQNLLIISMANILLLQHLIS